MGNRLMRERKNCRPVIWVYFWENRLLAPHTPRPNDVRKESENRARARASLECDMAADAVEMMANLFISLCSNWWCYKLALFAQCAYNFFCFRFFFQSWRAPYKYITYWRFVIISGILRNLHCYMRRSTVPAVRRLLAPLRPRESFLELWL